MTKPLFEAKNLTIQYRLDQGRLTAVSNVSFSIYEGEYFGLVGESGCGKSTIANAIIGAIDSNGEITSGEVLYKGDPIHNLTERELNEQIRWKEIAWIPQGSMNSLDPLQRINHQAIELAEIHTDLSKSEALAKFKKMLEIVGIQEERIHDYPHQLSGGMKQRVIIALALFLDSSLIVADEPTTALDVIMQDQIFKYMDDINENLGVSFLLITHDISLVFESCDRMAIMHSGQLAEAGTCIDLFDAPRHPYSILLQRAFPDHRSPEKELEVIEGNPPQTIGDVNYCTFMDRCPFAVDECRQQAPPLEEVGNQHVVSCIRQEDVYEEFKRNRESEKTSEPSDVAGDGT